MTLQDFHSNFRSDLKALIVDRVDSGEGPFPSEELVFAEMVMEHVADVGICETPVICQWGGRVGNSRLRITGYALSLEQSALDLFVTHYLGNEMICEVKDSVAIQTAGETIRFLIRAGEGKLESRIDPTHEIRNLVVSIRLNWSDLDRIRIFVITDGRTTTKRFANKEIIGKNVSVEAMDIERLYRHTEGKPREELALSFVQAIGRPLPSIHVPDPDADYEYALTAIPGQVIYDLYLRFGTRLLEANVRTFLGSRRAVNRGIVETLRKEPEHFLAFNNGLVIVCDDAAFERADDGTIGISFLKGLQIVNGGQTTSSIYFARRDDPLIDLSHVLIPAKIVILGGSDEEAREHLIGNVSRFANSQSAIRMSDLSANRPFHIQLEKLANETWCPDGATRWFYERAAGAYNVMMLREGTTPARRRSLKEITPPGRKLTKNDIAKYHEAWRVKPYQVALAGEKNFAAFMTALDEDPLMVPNPLDSEWYRSMIAKVILFKTIERMIKTKEAKKRFRQGWINVATYVVAVVSDRLGDRLDLEYIWRQQGISTELQDLLWDWAVVVNNEFNRIAPGQQISEVAKRVETWNAMREACFPRQRSKIVETAYALGSGCGVQPLDVVVAACMWNV